MNKNCKVLIPMMMDIHFDLIAGVLKNEGYDVISIDINEKFR